MDLKKIVQQVNSFYGITRKNIISKIASSIPIPDNQYILASFGEDAAVIEKGEEVLLIATDGIMEQLINLDPYWAGYCSVLVNVNDISAMGGIPLAMVNTISVKNEKILKKILKGLKDGIEKFGVPIVGGHTHPNSSYNALDVTILGTAIKNHVLYSNNAKNNDDIIFAMDLDGKLHSEFKYSWDTTSHKDCKIVRKQILIMNEIAEKNLANSAKDISNPGSLGTLGMLLEISRKGAVVNLKSIPIPKKIDFIHWLKVYQGCGFVLTTNPKNSKEIIKLFKSVGLSANVVGKINNTNKLKISDGKNMEILFDFEKDIITGIKKSIKFQI